jgi:hypothetical protein
MPAGVLLQPTAEGRRLWARVMRVIARRNEEIFGCLTAAEQRQLALLLDRVLAHARPDGRLDFRQARDRQSVVDWGHEAAPPAVPACAPLRCWRSPWRRSRWPSPPRP